MSSDKCFSSTGCWRSLTAILIAMCAGSISSVHGEEVWTDEVEAAFEKARAEDKDVLLNFTGSDWCVWCIKLEDEVFSDPGFLKSVQEKYVLVRLDFPRDASGLTDRVKTQNENWKTRFSVSGFPSVFLVDKEKRPYAKTGYQEGGPEKYMEHLDGIFKIRVDRDEALAKAELTKGKERAKHLDDALSKMGEEFATTHYASIVKEIVALDQDDEIGLRTKYYAAQDAEERKKILAKIAMAARIQKPEDAIKTVDLALTEMKLPPLMKIDALRTKLLLLRQLGLADEARSLLDDMIAIEGVEPEITHSLVVQQVYQIASSGDYDSAITTLDDRISSTIDNLQLYITKGELLDRMGQFEEAVAVYDIALEQGRFHPERWADLASAKADALASLDRSTDAVEALDEVIEDEDVPIYLKLDMLVQKGSLLREFGREEAAILAEKQAIEMAETQDEKREVQAWIDQLRADK